MPLGKNVLIKVEEAEKVTNSGIILPEQEGGEKSQKGEIVAVGQGIKSDSIIQVGEKVVFDKYAGTEIEVEKEKFVVVRGKDILVVLK